MYNTESKRDPAVIIKSKWTKRFLWMPELVNEQYLWFQFIWERDELVHPRINPLTGKINCYGPVYIDHIVRQARNKAEMIRYG
jgi:hypothetical protein